MGLRFAWPLAAALALSAACGGGSPTDPGGAGGGGGADGSHPYDSAPQAPALADGVEAPSLSSGDQVIVFTNSRLSDVHSAHTVNRIEKSHIVGAEVYVYDPSQPGKLLLLGRPDYGRVDARDFVGPTPKEKQKLLARELAFTQEHGLWAIQIEPINDEWLLSRWDLRDFTTPNQLFDVQLWAFPPEVDKADTLYWEDRVAGMEFAGGRLFVSTSGDPRADQAQGGQLYALDIELPPSYAVHPPPNDDWYMDAVIPGPLLTLPDHQGFSGDLVADGDGLWALGLYESRAAGPSDVNFLLRIDAASSTVHQAQETIRLRDNDTDVEVLALIDDTLYGITVEGEVLAIDRETGRASPHDDLGPLFRDLGTLRIRGGTTVVIP